jgi:hypothetical protein
MLSPLQTPTGKKLYKKIITVYSENHIKIIGEHCFSELMLKTLLFGT